MLHVDVETILQNTEAFGILESGGHPTEFFAHLNISIEHHVTMYQEHDDYKTAFDIALTKAISVLKAYARDLFAPKTEAQSTPYDEICAMEKTQRKKSKLSEEFNIYKHYIEDLESYMPVIKRMKTETPEKPPLNKDDATFMLCYTASSKPQESPIHATLNTST